MIKILIISDGKYGKRAIKIINEKYPTAEILFIEEKDPTIFLDEFILDPTSEQKVKEADLLILYVRHPDVVADICAYQKPTILSIHFGEGFFRQVKNSNPKIVQPKSMCIALPNTGIPEIDDYFSNYGTPKYEIKIKNGQNNIPIISEGKLLVESPCGASRETLKLLIGKEIKPESFNEFVLNVRQECKEPMTILFSNRDMADSSGGSHFLHLLDGIRDADPSLFRQGTELKDYIDKVSKEIRDV